MKCENKVLLHFAFVVFMEGPLYSVFDSWRNVFVKCTFQRDW